MNDEQSLPGAKEREIFLEALELPTPEARAVHLDRACGDNRALRVSVEALLQNHKNDDFLEMPAFIMGRSSFVTEKPGDYIGSYKLLQKIGEGGWGIVYKAEQQEPLHRFVALKIIKLGMDTSQVIERFEVERQALAMMEHPNIARVFDAGATDTGRSYFVMELVTGIPITQYCDEQKLSIQARLELFVPVCQAIQHAHQKGIIHRDIKPSNILVMQFDGRPMSKVIDFGIAKATQQLTDKLPVTIAGQFLGTPTYMSPEQVGADSQSIDARSDIYSLGVLLCELLVGRPPFPTALPKDEILRVIREKELPPPSVLFSKMTKQECTQIAQSRQTKRSNLLQLLYGDLDWVVIKCLDKDRTRRYQTANDLAAEIQRYLKGEPVTARPQDKIYQFQKMVKRHKLPFIVAAVIVVVLIVGFIGFWIATSIQTAKRILKPVEPAIISTNTQIPLSTSSPSSPTLLSQPVNPTLLLNWDSLDAVEVVNNLLYLGGSSKGIGTFGFYNTTTGKFIDLSNLLPSSWIVVHAIAYGDNQLVLGGYQKQPGHNSGRVGIYSPVSGSFQDVSSRLHDFYYGLGPVAFHGGEFLIGGAGFSTSLELASLRTGQFITLAHGIPFYFAVNSISVADNLFLIAGAGPGPGPGQPPALGWISSNGSFKNLTDILPRGWGASWHSAYDGTEFFLQGFDRATGANQMLALFNPSAQLVTGVTDSFPTSFRLHSIAGGNGFFLVGGQMNGNAYFARYNPGSSPTVLTGLLPTDAVDITAIKITRNETILGGIDQQNRIFLAKLTGNL